MRRSGILLHISSLPNEFGIGSLGKEAYEFVDFLVESGQSLWQILPLGHTSYGDSPYQCFSAFAGNPHFINLDFLKDEGLLKEEDYLDENYGENIEIVDYGLIFKVRNKILKKAYNSFKNKKSNLKFKLFKEENKFWLEDYSLYMAIKESFNLVSWINWDEDIRIRKSEELEKYKIKLRDEIEYYKFIQFKFFEQWFNLKEYANKNNIEIIGDLPIYVAEDSADIWSNPDMFEVDEDKRLKFVAGCPPDAFSETGQLWGNPIYDWKYLKNDDYKWWVTRIKESLKMYDVIRIDHFRGFESFWQIPYGEKTAINGKWIKGPGNELFNKVKEELGEVNIIAEDLGVLTNEVIEMLKKTEFPGMKVLQFAFSGEDNLYLPYNYEKDTVAYTGTHDNGTVKGWFKNSSKEEVEKAKEYLYLKDKDFSYSFIRAIWESVSETAIGTMQDFLELDDISRMNTPSTLGGNWQWRMKKTDLNKDLAERIYNLTKLYGRLIS